VEAILFDWDGTLVDSLGAFHKANAVVMESFGLSFDLQAYRRHYTPDWREMYRRLGIPHDRLDEANDLWEATFADDGDAVVAFPGAVAALERLRAAGAMLGIVTAGLREVVEPQLDRTGLARLLPIRVFGDDLAVHKPDPEPLRLALRLAGDGHRPETSIYVGDAPTDMLMAVAVGARPVGIESAVGDPDDLRAAGALELAPSVAAWVEHHLGRDGADRGDGDAGRRGRDGADRGDGPDASIAPPNA
jgi:pyrophosphatase PpaX